MDNQWSGNTKGALFMELIKKSTGLTPRGKSYASMQKAYADLLSHRANTKLPAARCSCLACHLPAILCIIPESLHPCHGRAPDYALHS